MTDITLLGIFPIGTGYRITLNDPTKSFEISVQDIEMYAKTGIVSSGLKEKINDLPGKLQEQILRTIVGEFKKSNSHGKKTEKKKEEVIVHKVRFSLKGVHYVEVSNNENLGFLKYNSELAPEFVNEVMTTDPDTGKNVKILPAPQIGQSKWDKLFDDDEKFEYIKYP
ncbi:MAG: hypothetical protein QXY74_06680 [Candidatus Bathyarchaeia archaeon]